MIKEAPVLLQSNKYNPSVEGFDGDIDAIQSYDHRFDDEATPLELRDIGGCGRKRLEPAAFRIRQSGSVQPFGGIRRADDYVA